MPSLRDLPKQGEPADPASEKKNDSSQRLLSLDAYRGFIMILLAASGFGLAEVARNVQQESLKQGENAPYAWQVVEYHFSHPAWISQTAVAEGQAYSPVNWIGLSAWDLIQPSFMFMVGVAMAFSYGKRKRRGDSKLRTWSHVAVRSVVLVLMGVFLQSAWSDHTNWEFPNVLSQIGLGYGFVYLLVHRSKYVQFAAAALLLIACWLGFFLYAHFNPRPDDFDYASVGVGAETDDRPAPLHEQYKMREAFAPWTKNVNAAAALDRRLLNLQFERAGKPNLALFARPERFEYNRGGYTTLNFVGSIFTMLLGVMAGQLLMGPRRRITKTGILLLAAVICLAAGAAAGATFCPVVKRIWTPSWALYSGGYVLAMLAVFYFLIDVCRLRILGWPLAVVGVNSILVYMMAQLSKNWIGRTLDIHLGADAAQTCLVRLGAEAAQAGMYAPIVERVMIVSVIWLICLWLYRQKIFIRV